MQDPLLQHNLTFADYICGDPAAQGPGVQDFNVPFWGM